KWKDGIFFARLWQQLSSSDKTLTIEARKACGYPIGKLHSNELSKKRIFVVTEKALKGITYQYSSISSPIENVGDDGKNIAKTIALYANYLGANIKKLVCTSTTRTPEKQADIMKNLIFNTPNGTNYKTTRKNVAAKYQEYLKLEISEEQYKNFIYNKSLEHINDNISDYKHVAQNHKYVFDIGPKESGMSTTDIIYMNTAFKLYETKNYINQSSLYYKETKDENAFHFVID
ncbi:MAG: hypothetical protein ACRCTQ_02955, partial [Brevinemataceae bacterium]